MAAFCATAASPTFYPTVGQVTAFDPSFNAIVPADARIEKIAEGISWAEGPAWVRKGGYLLFTDPRQNKMYRWAEKDGLSVFMEPAGYAGPPDSTLSEPGANGLLLEPAGTLLLADSGSRNLARFDPKTKQKTVLVDRFEGHRFNSPNDMVRGRDGTVYFTDPPFGLRGMDKSPVRETPFSGVYRLDPDGKVHLVDDSLKFPNGILLSPDGRRLYVSDTDFANPVWMVYALDARGEVTEKHVLARARDLPPGGVRGGNPDGMCMSSNGNLFTSAPGGLVVMNPDGKPLGRIETGSTVSNCTFGDDGHTLYMTSTSFVARVRVGVMGLGYGR
ncbi:MAG: SMP-30/gluconolactonase/LRE family protein [Pseudomonadota bacterium]